MGNFPFQLSINLAEIDSAVRAFSIKFAFFFDAVKLVINGMVAGMFAFLSFLPWWVLILAVAFIGWRVSGKIRTGFLYAALLFCVGLFGLWDMMNETLAVVLISVFISLLIGFPAGVLLAYSSKATSLMRPVLDTMQTMPVFVYLIPAVLFFGLGRVPAVIATTIYAVVPVIRLTSHGIRQVDAEVVEAAHSFGSTWFQTLVKVQIPQSLPTIMTGVNQTMMMAMAMVVTCSMIGANGLGMEVLISVNRIEMGRGLLAGTAVVIVAILIDRLTQGWFKENKPQGKSEVKA